jgi:hypothetical protein
MNIVKVGQGTDQLIPSQRICDALKFNDLPSTSAMQRWQSSERISVLPSKDPDPKLGAHDCGPVTWKS